MSLTETGESPPPSNSPPTLPFIPITSSAWWHRHLDPEERRRVMEELAITKVDHWAWRFTMMLTMSVIVAVMGLSANSAAVVIGAMLLAPLMQPVLASAASLSMSLLRKSAISLFRVAVATLWCVAIAYVLSLVIPDGPLSAEVEARTRPDIRDLVVALAAGAAGAYATVRKDASSALPGVAVAVALVPPLGTIGITLEAGEYDLAIGAMLLYGTNLAAIIFAGVMVFIATGFVPPKRLSNTALQLLVAAVIAGMIVVAIAVPLFNRSVQAVEAAEDEVRAQGIVNDWLGGADLQPNVDVGDNRILVQLRGFEAPPDDELLKESLQGAFGEVAVVVEWVRTERATTTTVRELTSEDELLMQITPIVEQWMADYETGADYELETLTIIDGDVRIDMAGSGDPPPVDDLVSRLADQLGTALPVRINWDPRETITPGVEATPTEIIERDIATIVSAWVADQGLVLEEEVAYDGERVRIVVIGADEPPIGVLLRDIEEVVGSEVVTEVYFTQRRLVTTTTIPIFEPFDGVPVPTTTTPDDPAGG